MEMNEQLRIVYMRTLRNWWVQLGEKVRLYRARRRRNAQRFALHVFKMTHTQGGE
jgi:hypothetical protein